MMGDRHPIVVKLKSGEYDGADIMAAWLLIEDQQQRIAELEAGRDRLRSVANHQQEKYQHLYVLDLDKDKEIGRLRAALERIAYEMCEDMSDEAKEKAQIAEDAINEGRDDG